MSACEPRRFINEKVAYAENHGFLICFADDTMFYMIGPVFSFLKFDWKQAIFVYDTMAASIS